MILEKNSEYLIPADTVMPDNWRGLYKTFFINCDENLILKEFKNSQDWIESEYWESADFSTINTVDTLYKHTIGKYFIQFDNELPSDLNLFKTMPNHNWGVGKSLVIPQLFGFRKPSVILPQPIRKACEI